MENVGKKGDEKLHMKNKWMKKERVYDMLKQRNVEHYTEDIEKSVSMLREWGFGGEREASRAYYNVLSSSPQKYIDETLETISEFIYNEKRNSWYNDTIGFEAYELSSYIDRAFRELPEEKYNDAISGIRRNSQDLRQVRKFLNHFIEKSWD